MLLAQVELRWLVELVHLAVDARADETLRHQVLHQLHVLTLAIIDDGRQQHQARACGQRQYLVDHLAHGLCFQGRVVIRAPRDAGACEQQAQVVIDLGDRAHRRAGIVRGGFLLDRNRGR